LPEELERGGGEERLSPDCSLFVTSLLSFFFIKIRQHMYIHGTIHEIKSKPRVYVTLCDASYDLHNYMRLHKRENDKLYISRMNMK